MAFALIIGHFAQVSAQEVYLGENHYLLTETVNHKALGGKMMYFNCTVKQVGNGGAAMNWKYDFMFYSDGLVVYDRTFDAYEKHSGRFNALSPGDHANTVKDAVV